MPGEVVDILEPFKKLTTTRQIEKNGEPVAEKVPVGVIYRSDGKYAWAAEEYAQNQWNPDGHYAYDEAQRWSLPQHLPDYAIRRRAAITDMETISLQTITKQQIELLHLDYASQGNPQILLEEYIPIKDYELWYQWWKQHYKATLKDNSDPGVIFLRLMPSA